MARQRVQSRRRARVRTSSPTAAVSLRNHKSPRLIHGARAPRPLLVATLAGVADAKRQLKKKCNPKKNTSCCRAPPPHRRPHRRILAFQLTPPTALACSQATRNRGVRGW